MKLILSILILLASIHLSAQTYNMAAGTKTTCAGTFYDPGGTNNYGNNLNITETFCSSTGCIRITFTSFLTQSGNDILTIYDGPNATSPVIGVFSGSTSPGIVTSSTGCLTFKFVSNSGNNKAGWVATISCNSCASTILLNDNTPVNTCSGLFYDSGGPSGNYGTSDNFTKTFCSSNGSCLQMEFVSFNTKAGDILTIYNGNSTASPLVGTYTGTVIPPVILSSNGCITVNFFSNGNPTVGAGWQAVITCEKCPTPPAASSTFTQPTAGQQNAYVGVNMVNTCGGTFTDNGGVNGNYSNSINNIYRTFCPSQAGNCLRANIWNLDLESPFDRLTILNGPTQNSPEFGAGSSFSTTLASYTAAMAAGAGPYISTDQSGCLTFRFFSDGTINNAGWVITFDCIPCANGPSGTDNNDCSNAMPVCSNASFTDASTGPGIVSDGGTGCVLAENFSNWYKIVIQSSGTLGLNIVPNVSADDYDFALYQTTSCSSLGTPVRCSYASNSGSTGLSSTLNLSTNSQVCGTPNSGSDVSEDVCGNGWVNNITVTAGQTYYLLVNKWSPGGSGFTLNWQLSGGASLNCVILPVELLNFDAYRNGDHVKVEWSTASEINNDYFIVERSADGFHFEKLNVVDGAGNSTTLKSYSVIDEKPFNGISYYRLRQVDYDGKYFISDTRLVNFANNYTDFILFPNPATDELNVSFNSEHPANDIIRIEDINSRIVFETIIKVEKGYNLIPVNTSLLAKGIYILSVNRDDEIVRKKLIVR
jgi:hypothetical protein